MRHNVIVLNYLKSKIPKYDKKMCKINVWQSIVLSFPHCRAMVQSAEATRWPEVWQTRSRSSSSRCTTGGGPTSPPARRRGASQGRSPAPATWSSWWVFCYMLQLQCSCFDVGRGVGEDCTETRWPVQLWPWLQRLQENIPVHTIQNTKVVFFDILMWLCHLSGLLLARTFTSTGWWTEPPTTTGPEPSPTGMTRSLSTVMRTWIGGNTILKPDITLRWKGHSAYLISKSYVTLIILNID